LLEHAAKIGEPEALIARVRKTLKQPGDSARHDDHLHVRVYCSPADKAYGCVDMGPMELFAERQAEPSPASELVRALTTSAPTGAPMATPVAEGVATSVAPQAGLATSIQASAASVTAAATAITVPERLGRLLHLRTDRVYPRSWR
jgi:hypothetical protein